VKIGKVLRT